MPWERSKKKAPSFDSLTMALPKDKVSVAWVHLDTSTCRSREGESWLQDDACSAIPVQVPVAVATRRFMMLMTKSKMARKRLFHW